MVLTIIVCSIMVMILVTITAVVIPTMTPYTGTARLANSTMYTTVSASFNGLALVPTLIIVGIAALIIALIVWAFRLFAASGAAD